MKQVIIYISMIVVAFLMIFIIKYNEAKQPIKIYFVNTYYSYVLDEEETIDIMFFINHDYPILDTNNYMDVKIYNEDQSKQMTLSALEINLMGSESYLGETYEKYMLELQMPQINQSFYIDDAILEITLTNDDIYQFYFGTLSLFYSEQSEVNIIDWQSLSAIKDAETSISRIKEIYVAFNEINQTIDEIYIGANHQVNWTINDDKLILTIDYDKQLLYACPIMIYNDQGDIQIIDYFLYINDYQILKESGMMLYGYLLS
ncbi:MAG: hypothetical protein WCR19_01505 [Acholeplasmataceae bacterium]